MKVLKKLFIATFACLAVMGVAFASDDKEEDESGVFCSLFPLACAVEPDGNGGGLKPPPPKS